MSDLLSESNRVRRLFRDGFTFQISVDTPYVHQALTVAEAALKAGVTILELSRHDEDLESLFFELVGQNPQNQEVAA